MTLQDQDGRSDIDDPDDLPSARFIPGSRRRPGLIWLVPVVALVVGAWLLTNLLNQRGPTVIISFLTAEGIAPGKTRIRYKDVDIGEVREVSLAPDRSHVLVEAQLVADAESFLAEDSRFWVVRPRVSGGKVSGIGTLLSGAYIGVDAGKSGKTSHNFVGLEVAPILTAGLPGSQFSLEAADIGSLDVGSPVFFRRIQVGEVVAHQLEKDGGAVDVTIFVHAPYDKYVKPRTRFWNASGIDISMDANGVRLQSQSLVSVMLGGIAFETPVTQDAVGQLMADWSAGKNIAVEDEVTQDTRFTLHPDRATAMKAADGEPIMVTLNFDGSVRGLQTGAPVDFRGITVGEVLSVGGFFDEDSERFRFPVKVALYTERISLHGKDRQRDVARRVANGMLQAINKRGLRAQLRAASLLTGQMYVALDYFPDVKPLHLGWTSQPYEFPSVRGDFEEFQTSLARVMAKIEKLPIEQIGSDVQTAIASLDHSLKGIDVLVQRLDRDVTPDLSASLKELRTTLHSLDRVLATDAPLQQDVRDTLHEVARAARSVRALADTIEQQPEAVLRGKTSQ